MEEAQREHVSAQLVGPTEAQTGKSLRDGYKHQAPDGAQPAMREAVVQDHGCSKQQSSHRHKRTEAARTRAKRTFYPRGATWSIQVGRWPDLSRSVRAV